MNTWQTLYIKEIKDNRTLFVLLPLLTVFLELVAVLSFNDRQALSPHFLWSVVPYSFVLILPFLLVHSFAQETKGQTHYLLLSLPVSRTQIFVAKVAAVATLGLVLFALSTAGLIKVIGDLYAFAIKQGIQAGYFAAIGNLNDLSAGVTPALSATNVLVLISTFYLPAIALMLGIASGIAGLKLVVRRFAGLAATAFVLGVLYCYFSALPDVLDLPLGTYEAVLWINYEEELPDISSVVVHFSFIAYSLLVGLACMGLGMWLFEKCAEA